MKLSELIKLTDSLAYELSAGMIEDLELIIPNNKKSYGTISHTKVKSLTCGFDWDNGFLIITPENKMIEK